MHKRAGASVLPHEAIHPETTQTNSSNTMKNRPLKTAIVAALALMGIGFTAIPTTAEAGPSARYSHRCNSCNSGIYKRQVLAGYTRCGDPIYRWVTVSHRCSSHRGHGHGHSHGHSHSHHSRHIQPHDVISGIVTGIINSHRDRRGRHCH